MSDTAIIARSAKDGRFLAGNSGNGGRRPGARGKLGEQFISDLRESWMECGAEALRRCADEDPTGYIKVIASLLPKTIDLNVAVDPVAFADKFRLAVEMLGNELPPRKPVKVLNAR